MKNQPSSTNIPTEELQTSTDTCLHILMNSFNDYSPLIYGIK